MNLTPAARNPSDRQSRRAFLHSTLATTAATRLLTACQSSRPTPASPPGRRHTRIAIVGEDFHLNGLPTYQGRTWNGHRIEGLLLNSRMVQATFDDRNPETTHLWAYPDTGRWDPDRNLRECLDAMPEWRRHGLLAFTVNFQGGSPQGYSNAQPWRNSAILPDGTLDPDHLGRMAAVLDHADALGMAVIVGFFYFGQDQHLADEDAVVRATHALTDWLIAGAWTNVLVEINNECDVRYDHPILQPARVHELIQRVQRRSAASGRPLAVGTSYGGGSLPRETVIRTSDFLLLHGNGVADPARIADMVRRTRALPGYTPKPILFNEDDHFDFEQPANHFSAALSEHASWGYFDYRMRGEGFADGFQSVPVNWSISSDRKRAFFRRLAEITGSRL